MSELARRERMAKRGWARPGSAHDRLITLLKVALPTAVGILLAFLALAPLKKGQEVSFVLDKNQVEVASERMRVQSAQYRGQDKRGRPFVLDAGSAVQASSADPVVEVRDIAARLRLDNGPATLAAGRGRYDMEKDHVDVLGPIMFTAADGYRLQTSDVHVDLREQTMRSDGPVQGRMPLGRFTAGQLEVDLPDRRVVLSNRARLHIEQGKLK